MHNLALRLWHGAYRTSPCQSLYTETNELALNIRRKKLSINYTLKLISNPNNATYISVFNQQLAAKFASKAKTIPPFVQRMQILISSDNIELDHIVTHIISVSPPWKSYHLSYLIPISIIFDIDINNII